MIHNILVPVDFSVVATIGLEAAVSLAERFNCKVNAVHFLLPNDNAIPIHPNEAVQGKTDSYAARRKSLANDKLREMNALMQEKVPAHLIGDVYVVHESLQQSFDLFTQELDSEIDLIVAGTSKERDLMQLFSGSKFDQMIRQSEIPVLAISHQEDLRFNRVAFVTDLGTHYPEKLIALCKSLQHSGSELTICHVISTELMTEVEVTQRILDMAKHNDIIDYKIDIRINKDEVDGIHEMMKEVHPDLIFMKTHKKSAFQAFFKTSIAERAIRETQVPVAVESI